MMDGKSLLQSKTFWGVVLSFVGKVLAMLGLESAAAAATDPSVLTWVMAFASVIGDGVAMYGLWAANKTITSVLPTSDVPNPPAPPKVMSPWLIGFGVGLLALAGFLGGCTQQQLDDANAKAQATLVKMCEGYPIAHEAFLAVVTLAPNKVPQKVVTAETAAAAAMKALCEAPPQNIAQAIASATRSS